MLLIYGGINNLLSLGDFTGTPELTSILFMYFHMLHKGALVVAQLDLAFAITSQSDRSLHRFAFVHDFNGNRTLLKIFHRQFTLLYERLEHFILVCFVSF